MAERNTAVELRSYGLRRFLLDQYDRVMDVETSIQLTLARRTTTTISVGSVIGNAPSRYDETTSTARLGAIKADATPCQLRGSHPVSPSATSTAAALMAGKSSRPWG